VGGERSLTAHGLDRLPKADVRADRPRNRRALTEDELRRLLAAERPLLDARTVHRGKRRGQACARTPEAIAPTINSPE